MKTPEEHAGILCRDMHQQFSGSDWTKTLPQHIHVMLGHNSWHKPLWRRRVMPPEGKVFELQRFEDYLMLPFREGLGFGSCGGWWTLDSALNTQGREGLEAINLIRDEVPGYDEKVERDQQKNLNAQTLPLAKYGEIGNGRSRVDIINSTQGGTSAPYRLSRLKRDAPCYAERFASGEFRSVSAAVKAAVADGAISWGRGKTLDQQLIALWKKASRDEQSAFLAWMRENTTDS